jgi:multidrug resistance protein
MKDKRLGIIFLTVFIDLVGFGIIIPLNPYLAESFGASPLEIGLLMSVYSLMQFLAAPVWGQLSDRHGRRPIILISLLGAALAHTGFALSTSFMGLVIMRGLAGLFGGNISTAMAYIADITTEQNRSKGMGLVGAAFGLGFMCGPVIGGVFAHSGRMFGEGPPFNESFPALIAAAICLVNFFCALRYLPESLSKKGPAKRESRFARIVRAFSTPVLSGVMALVFFNTLAMALIEAPLFLYVQSQFQWDMRLASFGFAYIGLIMVFTQGYLIRKFMPKLGERKVLAAGLLLSAVGFGLTGYSDTIAAMAVAVTFIALGSGMVNPSLHGSVSLLSGKEVQGNNLGVSQSLSSIARIVGPPMGGAFYQQYGSHTPFFSAALLVACAFAGVMAFGRKLPEGGKAH